MSLADVFTQKYNEHNSELEKSLNFLLFKIENTKGDFDLDKVFNIITEEFQEEGIDSVVTILDEKKENINLRHLSIKNKELSNYLKQIKKFSLDSFSQYKISLKNQNVVYIENRIRDLRKNTSLMDILSKIQETNSLILPLIIRGQVIGFLEIYSKNLKKQDIGVFNTFSKNLISVLTNAILFHELKEAEKKQKEIYENSKEGFVVMNGRKKKFIDVNKAMSDITGYTEDELRQMNFVNIFHPDEKEKINNVVKYRLEGRSGTPEAPMHYQTRLLTKQHEVKYIKITIVRFINKDEWFSIIEDITERKMSEKALKISEIKYRNLFDNAVDGIFLWEFNENGPGRCINVNKVGLKILGYTKEEILGKTPFDLNLDSNKKKVSSFIKNIKQRGFAKFETEHMKKDGGLVPVSVSAHIMSLNGDKVFMAIHRDISNRRKAEYKLRKTEEKYRKLVNNAKDGVLVLDKDCDIEFANKYFLELTGYKKSELESLNLFNLIKDEQYKKIKTDKSCLDKKFSQHDFELTTKQEKKKFVSYKETPIYKNDEVVGFQAIVRDVTEKKELTEKIFRSKQHYEQIIDTIQDGICVLNKEHKIVSCNKYFSKQVNIPINKIKGMFCYKVLPSYADGLFKNHCSREKIKTECYVREVFKQKKFISYIEENLDKKGESYYHLINLFPAKDKNEEIYQVVLTIRDVTERRRSENQIKILSEFNKRIFDNVPVSIIVLDNNGKIIRVNNNGCSIMNQSEKRLIGINLIDSFDIKSNLDLSRRYKLLLKKGEPFYFDNLPYKQKVINKTAYLNIIAVPLYGENKEIEGAISMAVDNTEAVLAKQRLEDMNRNLEAKVMERAMQYEEINKELERVLELKSKFISDASHELRTPLTIIQGNLDLAIRESKNENMDIPELYMVISKEVERMTAVLSDLALLTNADASAESFEYEPINLNMIIKDVERSLAVLAKQKNIKIKSKKTNPKNLYIMGDETKIEKLVLNIVRNAIRYTNKNGWVKVWLKKEEKEACVIVEDNGVGIPNDQISFIFERFYRVDKARSRSEGGTGIGLAICDWIVKAHNGKIEVESIVGKGTKFTIRIPYKHRGTICNSVRN